jgi:predicted lipoprotein with Yx(FWY)xxD motif
VPFPACPVRAAAVALSCALALAACADEPDPGVAEVDADEPDPGVAEVDADPPDAADGAEVAVAAVALGDVVVDADGMTLYVFEPDAQGPSTCYDDCAASWPPLLTESEPQPGAGVDAALLATAERDDGARQVTYDGWPLYHWAGDEAPGDTDGQGVGDAWWVIDPDGAPLRADPGEDADDGGGY